MSVPKSGGLGRRDLFKGAALAGLSLGLGAPAEALAGGRHGKSRGFNFPQDLRAPPDLAGTPGSEKFWRSVRKAFPLAENYIHMNTGTTGSQPEFSLNNLAVYDRWKSEDPRDWSGNLEAAFPSLMRTTLERQTEIASMFNADPTEIVLSYNTSDACNMWAAGTPWKAGDRIITTSFEHPALAGPIAAVRDTYGVQVVVIYLPSNWDIDVATLLDWFETELAKPLPSTDNKQYVATCEIFYKNGVRMPVQALCALARDYGAYSFIDNAHGWGMIPVDCHGYGADFIAGAGHKWLCGGPGTGIFYVRNAGGHLPPFNGGRWSGFGGLFGPGARRVGTSFDPAIDKRSWNPNSLSGLGETNTPALYAMSDAASFFNKVGLQNIYNRGTALAQYLQTKIIARWGLGSLALQNLYESEFRTFLTAVNPFVGKDSTASYVTLRDAINAMLPLLAGGDPKIYIRSITWRDSAASTGDDRVAFRISTHAMYNNYDEVDELFNRLVELVDASGLPQLSG